MLRQRPRSCPTRLAHGFREVPGPATMPVVEHLTAIDIPHERLAELCRRHCIRKLALFGSVLRDDFRPESDLDVLVEFEPGQTPGLAFISLQDELSELLGRKVDLNTPDCLSRYFRERVLREARVIYDAA